MKEIINRIVYAILLLALSMIILNKVEKISKSTFENTSLVVFGDNITSDREPFVEENGGIYIPFSTISKVIDENIFYDKVATKVIVTTDDKVIKLKLDENKMNINLKDEEISTPAKLKNEYVYVDINLLKDVYNIDVSYNKDTNIISIDSKKNIESNLKYNNINVYSDITTKSDVLKSIGKSDKVIVYNGNFKHNRWYKIKTEDGIIGYISKNSIDDINFENEIKDEEASNDNSKKYVMFWQYGSDLDTLGKKENGVNVVLPTWYELSNSYGDISSKSNVLYYNKAKSNGYEIWATINNGIDSANYTADDTSALVNSESSREKFIINLLKKCKEDNVDGINMDFEAMKTDDRKLYTQLIREMTPIFRENNIKVSVDLYFVEYIDRKGIGAASDYVILMGYDQRGGWSSASGSISEISWIEGNINSLINDSKIPSNKIILGIPFYTRLWIEKQGEDELTTKVYTMQDCQDFIYFYNLTPTYDEASGQNYVEHTRGSLTYKLWIEDETSVKNRINAVKKYNLAGISAWRRGFETDNIWNVINDNINE